MKEVVLQCLVVDVKFNSQLRLKQHARLPAESVVRLEREMCREQPVDGNHYKKIHNYQYHGESTSP